MPKTNKRLKQRRLGCLFADLRATAAELCFKAASKVPPIRAPCVPLRCVKRQKYLSDLPERRQANNNVKSVIFIAKQNIRLLLAA